MVHVRLRSALLASDSFVASDLDPHLVIIMKPFVRTSEFVQSSNIRPIAVHVIRVRDNSHPYASFHRVRHRLGDFVTRQLEYAHVQRKLGGVQTIQKERQVCLRVRILASSASSAHKVWNDD